MLLGAMAHGAAFSPVEMTPGKEGFAIAAERLPNGMRFTATYKYSSGSFADYQVSLSVVQVHLRDDGWDFSTKLLRELPGEQQGQGIVCVFDITPEELEATLNMAFTIIKPNHGDAPAASLMWFVPLAKVLVLQSESKPGPQCRSSIQPLLGVRSSDGSSLPAELRPLAREAEAESGRGHFARAEKIYLQVLAKAPNDVDTLSNLGVALLRGGKGTLAEGPLNRALALAPKHSFARCALGVAHYEEANYFDAINDLTKALAINPNSFMAHYYLGITLGRMGYRAAAGKELQTSKELEPEDCSPRF